MKVNHYPNRAESAQKGRKERVTVKYKLKKYHFVSGKRNTIFLRGEFRHPELYTNKIRVEKCVWLFINNKLEPIYRLILSRLNLQ